MCSSDLRAIRRLIEARGTDPTTLIEVLHRVQKREGHLSAASLHQVACGLSLPLSQVLGVASFYHLFRRNPAATHRCAVCLGTACYVLGAHRLLAAVQTCLADAVGWEVERTGCLAACGATPVLRIDQQLPRHLAAEPGEALERALVALGLPSPATAAGDRQP